MGTRMMGAGFLVVQAQTPPDFKIDLVFLAGESMDGSGDLHGPTGPLVKEIDAGIQVFAPEGVNTCISHAQPGSRCRQPAKPNRT